MNATHEVVTTIPHEPGCYLVQSQSDPNMRYRVEVDNGVYQCGCLGHEMGKQCWHLTAVKEYEERQKV